MNIIADNEADSMDKKIEEQSEENTKVIYSKLYTKSFYMAAKTINSLHGRNLDLMTLVDELMTGSKKITDGETQEIERILMAQAKTLEYVFYDSLKKLTDLNMINQIEVFTNIAFRAQTQCRKTLVCLAELKHPRRSATFIKQQNNAINQQVNNPVKTKPRQFENSEKLANELLSEVEHETLDFSGTPKAIRANQTMETVDVGGGKDNGRKKHK